MLFLGACRRGEIDESSFQRQWSRRDKEEETSAAQREISLQPLDQEQCIALVTARSGVTEDAARDVAARLFENTRGNPYFLEQIIEGFNAGATDWRPLPLREFIAQQLLRFPKGSEQLPDSVASTGQATATNHLAAHA